MKTGTLKGEQMALPFRKPYRPFKQYLVDIGATPRGVIQLDPVTENGYFEQFRIDILSQLLNGQLEPTAAVVADLGRDAYLAAACAKNIDVLEGRIESFEVYWEAVRDYMSAAGIGEGECRADFEKLKKKAGKHG